MVGRELARLIAQYQWLRGQKGQSGTLGAAGKAMSIEGALNDLFVAIIQQPAEDARVSYRQIAFLLEVLADDTVTGKAEKRFIRDAVLGHVKHMADKLAERQLCAVPAE